ncbi:MAG TPA: methionyl-tRNA formyltransferase [Proteobacteria bacterium]|nr:methionyl-tRNA formyltransferase [Pseudomonadota bacterium]
MDRLKVVFFGTPDFAVPVARMIRETEELLAVVTQPDKPKGRGRRLAPPPVKVWATEAGVELSQPERLRDGGFLDWLRSKGADLFCVAAYGKILPKEILDMPRFGCINVHASLLPRWRGAAPINWAIIEGDKKTGITIMQMDEGMDTGPILLQRETEIGPHERAGELEERLSRLGADALRDALTLLKRGELKPIPQPQEGATLAPTITKEMANIDWTQSAERVVNLVRGLHPQPCAYTLVDGRRLKIHRAIVRTGSGASAEPGTVVEARGSLVVAAGDGLVELLEVQPEGRRVMDAAAFLRGHRIGVGARLGR